MVSSASGENAVPKRFKTLVAVSLLIAILMIIGLSITLSGDKIQTSQSFALSVGIINSMIGSFLTASGYICQKEAHNLE